MMHGPIDFDLEQFIACDDDPPPSTVPVPGSAKLDVEDKCAPLFLTAEWTIIATVGPHELGRSTTIQKSHSPAFVKRWTRQLIRMNKARLKRLGVDVSATYQQWGGRLEDLDD